MSAAMTLSGESSAEQLLSHPGVQRFPSSKLDLFVMRDFLSPEECEELVALIEAQHRPSTIADANGDDAFRTSSTCDLDAANPAVSALAAKLSHVSGIDLAHAEPLQGQRYEVGQEFKAHTDYFEPNSADYQTYCATSGQRTWTFMLYLNDVEAGGATRFRAIGKTIQPETGKLVAWNNHRADGSLNPATLHHAMKVRKGRKYVITQWYRERPWG
jgi:prolyl 4-hydroxylase